MTNDYLQEVLSTCSNRMEQSDNELFVSVLPSALTGTFRETGLLFDYRSHPSSLLKAMESSTARMDNHRTVIMFCIYQYAWNLSALLQYNLFLLTLVFIFHPEQSNTLYQRFDRYSFLISSLPGNCLLFIVSVWNYFRTNFLQTKRLPYVTGYKSGTCCRMAPVMAKLCFLHPGQSVVHIH